MDRSHFPTRKLRLQDPDDGADMRQLSPGDRLLLVWPLTLQAWAFLVQLEDEPRLRRDAVRVVRGGR